MAEPLLRVERVFKRFGGLLAVDNASLAVEAGRIIALIGPNGAGKTTLFSIISGFLPPSEGRIFYRGDDITGMPPHLLARRGIVRTFQIVQPFAGLTVHVLTRLTPPRKLQAQLASAISSAVPRRASPSQAASGWKSHERSRPSPNSFYSTRCLLASTPGRSPPWCRSSAALPSAASRF